VINDLFEIIGGLAQMGQTILLAEQNARKALKYAERAYVFEAGNIVLEGNSDELLCDEAVIQAYLGGGGRS
jgi:branched-chain amino acid transport system ATP-binding protein